MPDDAWTGWSIGPVGLSVADVSVFLGKHSGEQRGWRLEDGRPILS